MNDRMTTLTRKRILADMYYTPSHLMRSNLFPWVLSTMTLMAIIKSPRGKELFKPIIRQGKKNVRYYIKGADVLHVLELADQGRLEL